ncbi:hypothetical protein AK812_SmicGene9927 [Symbiodinium microadriaticum]|uniref:Uncharacterized protein n=1 Tax=Symbiodinium microadriaticum TaxID=2951 RepID=A0A1Q9EH38_SYMMI|nr:hypothetical protein AK812_SmicGene9927 [Symbiodinium microadriaticum]
MPPARSWKNEGVELASRRGNEQAAQMLVQAQVTVGFGYRTSSSCVKAMPAAHSSNNEGVELASRGNEQAAQMLVQAQSGEAFVPDSRRRCTLADMRKDLEALQKQQPRWRWRAKVVLAFYALARIAGSLPFTHNIVGCTSYCCPCYEEAVNAGKVCDAILRPLVTGFGLYVFIHRMDRFSVNNHLHKWSLATLCCLALPLCDGSMEHVLILTIKPGLPGLVMLLWEVLCNVLQVYMTILKLRALGWHRTARCCSVLSAIGLLCLVVTVAIFVAPNNDTDYHIELFFIMFIGCFFAVVGIQCWALCRAASRVIMQARGDEAVRWTACLLYANACLVPLGPALSFVSLGAFLQADGLPRTAVTVDVSFQVFNVIILSGMVGSTPMNLETLQKLAAHSGFGLTSGNKRVPFPGHISRGAADCVVSFPGKYSELWDKAVSSADAFSLACVFLTDADRAPWGCQWFEEWKRNVDRAAELQQTLHVFYFQDSKGKGKMHWDQLANEKARHAARKDSGLGASQTAEVAYLDKIGLSYVEHDIMEFEAFLTSQT